MNLNNISLPPQLVADLYQHSLVESEAAVVFRPETVAKPTAPVSFLGKNQKGILIVVNQPDAPFLPDAELAFLTKVLTACHLGLLDVAIVNWSKIPQQKAAFLLANVEACAIILFDINPTIFGLPARLPLYTVQAFSGKRFVAAPKLKAIEDSKEAKGLLWSGLKTLFGL